MPKKPIQEITQNELNQEVREGVYAQPTPLDKLWYYLNSYALYNTADAVHNLNRDGMNNVPDRDDIEQQRREAEAYRKNNPDSFFMEGEKEKIQFPIDPDSRRKVSKASDVVETYIMRDAVPDNTMEQLQKSYKTLGILQAKLMMEFGKEYEEKLKSIPEDDPDREDKAAYLQIRDTHSRANMLAKSYKDFQNIYYGRNSNLPDGIMKDSPIPDAESLKKMTMGEFLDCTFTEKAEQEEVFLRSEERGFHADRSTNVYEFYKRRLEAQEQKKKEANPEYKPQPITDKEVYYEAKKRYTADLMQSVTKFSMNAVREGLNKNDRKTFDIGRKLFGWKEYKPPKNIREWAKNTADPMLRENRADRLNQQYDHFTKQIDRRKAFDLEKDPALRNAFGYSGPKASPYDQFIRRHLGAGVLLESPEERREHLALVMAANAVCSSTKGIFDISVVPTVADDIRKRDAFKNMTDTEVSMALVSKENAIQAQGEMIRRTFTVPKEKRADYIRKMKALSESMVPAKGQSAKYQAMKKSVDFIGSLNPSDPKIESKLVSANAVLLADVSNYTKGKKSMRSFRDSQARFDNSIDVLAVANEHVPGMKQYAKEIVDRTNAVRKTHPGDKNYVDLDTYGTERAEQNAPKGTAAYNRKNAGSEEKAKENPEVIQIQ